MTNNTCYTSSEEGYEYTQQVWCESIKDLLRYDPTSCLVALLPILIGRTGQTVLKIKNLLMNTVRVALTMMCAESREDWTKIVGGVGFQRFFIKPEMAENLYNRKLTS